MPLVSHKMVQVSALDVSAWEGVWYVPAVSLGCIHLVVSDKRTLDLVVSWRNGQVAAGRGLQADNQFDARYGTSRWCWRMDSTVPRFCKDPLRLLVAFWELLAHRPLYGGGIVCWVQPGPWALSQTGYWVYHSFGFSCCTKDVACFRIVHVTTMALPLPSMPWNCLFTSGKQCYLAAYPNTQQLLVFIERPMVVALPLLPLHSSALMLLPQKICSPCGHYLSPSRLSLDLGTIWVRVESIFFHPGWCPTCYRSEMLEFITG